MAKVKSVQDMLTAGASKGMGDEEERRRQSFLAQLNSTGPAVAKPSPVLAALAPTVAKAPAETAPPAPPAPPSMMAMTPPAFLQEMDKTPKGRRAPEPPPTSPAPPERGPQPATAVPPPPPPPAEPEVPPVDEGTTGPRKGPKIPEPEPEEPTSPAPPDRSRPTGGGTTNLPPNPVTTPSPPVAPRGGTATPRDDSKTTPRTARPRRGRWNIQSFLRALQQPGGYGAAFAGGDELAELTAYLDQQRQAEAARSQRLQTLLQGRQTQPRVASARPGVR